MPQLLIEIGTALGHLAGGAAVTSGFLLTLASAFRMVAPLVSEKVARNLAISRGHKVPRKRD